MEHFERNKFLFGGYFQFQLAVLCDIQLDEQIAQNYSVCDVQFQLSNKRVRRSVLGEDNQLSNVGKNRRREVEQGGNALFLPTSRESSFPVYSRQRIRRLFRSTTTTASAIDLFCCLAKSPCDVSRSHSRPISLSLGSIS